MLKFSSYKIIYKIIFNRVKLMSAKNSYYLGIFWFILSIFCSLTNDVLSKYANNALHPFQVLFLDSYSQQ